MLNGDVAFLDVDIRRAVFTHRPQLDQVTIGQEFTDGKQYVQRADDVVYLRKNGVLPVDHGVRSGALLCEVYDGFRLERLERGGEKIVVGYVADEHFDGFPG